MSTNPTQASVATKFKVGLFTVLGLLLLGAATVYVNDKPFWWRPCQLVRINIEDGTGLKSKSPVRSLGIEIGYLSTVELTETHVALGICITAPVEVLPSTRAYIRGEGFLGDKFVELKPVKYVGPREKGSNGAWNWKNAVIYALDSLLFPDASAATSPGSSDDIPDQQNGGRKQSRGREIPVSQEGQDVQKLVNRVDELVNEMTGLTNNLKQAINPEELRKTMNQLNRTLENASKTLSPEGGLNQTAQRTLAKLEDAIEQLRAQLVRVNRGEGSVGMLLNDPSYAEEIHEAIRNVNHLLSKVGDIRFVIDVGGELINGYSSARAWFQLAIWPKPDRYYLLGISADPRGHRTNLTTTTTTGNIQSVTHSETVEETAVLLTGMLGKTFGHRLDLSLGLLYGDGGLLVGINLGPTHREELIQFSDFLYAQRGSGTGVDNRAELILRPWTGNPNPWSAFYVRGGIESVRQVNGNLTGFIGAGLAFDDENIKLLFALR